MSVVFLFPGQGSQKVNMLADYAEAFPQILDTFSQATDVLGYDVWASCQDEELLNKTEYTQPALLTSSIAIWRLWEQMSGKKASLIAGHSLGEYSALVAAGSLAFEDAVSLVHLRGKLMQQAVPEGHGAMAAVLGKSDEKVAEFCAKVSTADAVVAPANYNCNGQVVVSGHAVAIDALAELAKEEGFKVIKLAVSVPSHCELMLPAEKELAQKLETVTFSSAKIPVVQNVGAQVNQGAGEIKQALLDQLSQPVQWSKTMQYIQQSGTMAGVECGPGNTLTGLAKRQKLDFTVKPTGTVDAFNVAITDV